MKLHIICAKHNRYPAADLVVNDCNGVRNDEIQIEIEPCPDCLQEAREEGEQNAMEAEGE